MVCGWRGEWYHHLSRRTRCNILRESSELFHAVELDRNRSRSWIAREVGAVVFSNVVYYVEDEHW